MPDSEIIEMSHVMHLVLSSTKEVKTIKNPKLIPRVTDQVEFNGILPSPTVIRVLHNFETNESFVYLGG
jgi:hypothetical protein